MDVHLGVPGATPGSFSNGAVEMVQLPLDLEGLVPPEMLVLLVVGGGEGEGGVVTAGVLAELDRIVPVRGPHLPHPGRRIPVGRELDGAIPAAEVKFRVRVGRRAGAVVLPQWSKWAGWREL